MTPSPDDLPRARPPLPLCPSARADQDGAVVFGVVGEGPAGRLGYLSRTVPVTLDVLTLVGPADPADVFRVAAPCAEGACRHFEDARCRLATRVAQLLPAAEGGVPPCRIRPDCRWWQQEGRDACLRCPLIASGQSDPTALMARVADPDTPTPAVVGAV